MVLRCDNEPSILALLRAVKLAWTGGLVLSLGSASPLDRSCAPRSETRTPRQHMLLKWPGRWIRRAVPTSGFLNFINLDRFGVAEAPLSHFVTHVNIARSSCKHVWRLWPPSLVPPFSHTKSPTHQLYPILFLSTVLRVVQAYSAWYSPPTDIHRRPVLSLARP